MWSLIGRVLAGRPLVQRHRTNPAVQSSLAIAGITVALAACTGLGTAGLDSPTPEASEGTTAGQYRPAVVCTPANTVRAEIVALEQAYVLNRFGAYVPAGMLYALRRDVVALDSSLGEAGPGNARLRSDKRPRPLVLRVHEGGCLQVTLHNWMSPDWDEEGGEPPDPTVTVGDRRVPAAPAHLVDPPGTPTSRALKRLGKTHRDAPRTRSASFFVTGLEVARPAHCPVNAICGGDGTYVGQSGAQGTFFNFRTSREVRDQHRSGSVVQPGQTSVTLWTAPREGTFFAHSMGAPVGGEGDGGQIGLGLFAAVNVEPPESKWYRSQVTQGEIDLTREPNAIGNPGRHPYATMDYDRRVGGRPVLSMLDRGEIIHSDLNAVIVRSADQLARCNQALGATIADGQRCEPSFREFTVIMHDEVHAVQAFPELEDEDNPLSYIKDGMGINYGVSSMGSTVYAAKPQRGVGPAAQCAECRAEEFFLSSWANGDPALVLQWDEQGRRPIGARYPDDPSNVHHSYLGDPVVFRNLHAGPKETHVFHLHAHQWVLDASDPNSTYLDSQTISPGATFSYGIEFGGSGNRNFTPGDSIFHCHLYPHFAQGMWELWRVHEVFENGLHAGMFDPDKPTGVDNDPRSRSLPDGEVSQGIVSPAVVPVPGRALPPIPSASFRGYPFYVPGEPGHRPPQPVLDMDVNDPAYVDLSAEPPDRSRIVDGGLPRHVIRSGELHALNRLASNSAQYRQVLDSALAKGGDAAQVIARKVASDFPLAFQALAAEWHTLDLKLLPHSGTQPEQAAMRFHEGRLALDVPMAHGRLEPAAADALAQPQSDQWSLSSAYRTEFAATVAGMTPPVGEPLFRVNGRPRAPGAPYANPCPRDAPMRDYKVAYIQTELTVNRHGWFDPQARLAVLEDDVKDVIDADRRTRLPEPLFFRANSGDCISFKSSNLIPNALNADDFQVYTPTDTIGQHIHLVKFDVTSSDGSGNGFNYEDGTFSPDEVRERVLANNRSPGATRLSLKAHPLFSPGGSLYDQSRRDPYFASLAEQGACPAQGALSDHEYKLKLDRDHPFCGAQRTTQLWWADPFLVRGGPNKGKDNTLRTVFSHDHFGPSSHQQHGLYAALVIEPANSVWRADPPADLTARAALEAVCKQAGEAATRLGLSWPTRDLAAIDQGVAAAFAVRQHMANPSRLSRPDDKALRAPAEACLAGALLGGSDLSAAVMPAEGKRSAPIASLQPRPPFRHPARRDGGPTATRATIVSPTCISDANSSPYQSGSSPDCRVGAANQTRREFGLAFADFAGVYNLGLEPINTETRDTSMRRFGERQVAVNPSRPLIISSEDPGTQLVNYRHEPLALRISDVRWSSALGGFDYRQSRRRAGDAADCAPGDTDCLGDMSNGFSSTVHADRDRSLATRSYIDWLSDPALREPVDLVSPRMRSLFKGRERQRLADVATRAEQWRQDFNCALYAVDQWRPERRVGAGGPAPIGIPDAGRTNSPIPVFQHHREAAFAAHCARRFGKQRRAVQVAEPWRVFGDPATPVLAAHEGDPIQIRLIQGAQEAQHVFAMNGLKWHRMVDSENSGFVAAQPLGISEHFEFDVRVPSFNLAHADYLYYGSSVDQLWDGMWGVLRSFCVDGESGTSCPKATGSTAQTVRMAVPAQQLNRVPQARPTDSLAAATTGVVKNASAQTAVCAVGRKPEDNISVKSFDVSAAKVCELYGNCGKKGSGIVYSKRWGITDPDALVYVLNGEDECHRKPGELVDNGCLDPRSDQAQTWARLEREFRQEGREIEPLVLRASAGQCITVKLRNHLQPNPAGRDVPVRSQVEQLAALGTDGERQEDAHRAYYNFLPMITDGFNLNQFSMSSAVGLSVPMLAQNPALADGSNVGMNGAALATNTGVPALQQAGSLVPACGPGADCSRNYVWSATDLHRIDTTAGPQIQNRAVEFGALPLRSFGDPIKHPVHGLAGALVIGPEHSVECKDPSQRWRGGTSSAICSKYGKRLFGDHVLMMQDAVSAIQGGFPVPDLSGAEEPDDYGVKAINYRTEPLWARRGGSPSVDFGSRGTEFDYTNVFSSVRVDSGCEAGMPPNGNGPDACDPETPVIQAARGESLRLHFVHPGGHTRQQGLVVSGHGFHPFPWRDDSRVFDPLRCETTALPIPTGCLLYQGVYNGFGPMMGTTLAIQAGGAARLPKDYLLRTQASFLLDGGLWGILRVR